MNFFCVKLKMFCYWSLGQIATLLSTFFICTTVQAQTMGGDLTIQIYDSAGLALPAHINLTNQQARFSVDDYANSAGKLHLRRLPMGTFDLQIRHPGFRSQNEQIVITSALPIVRQYILEITALETTLNVRENNSLIDASQPGNVFRIGRKELNDNPSNVLGRSIINAVNTLPGWLLEANAVLHPRGSEYDTQYVIDGMPLYDNRSLGFISGFGSNEFESVRVITANIPAEFGRRLGGIIELSTRRPSIRGRHSEISFESGSFSTNQGTISNQYRREQMALVFGLYGGYTNRYLDPPSLENFTNRGSSAGFNVGFDYDITKRDQLRIYFRSNRLNFLVPNTLEQQYEQQRQDRQGMEAALQVHHQHIFSPRVMIATKSMIRDVGAKLWSNPFSTPVFVEQNRGFREGVLSSIATFETEHHTIKFGGDYRKVELQESFFFKETLAAMTGNFRFDEKLWTTDAGIFAQTRYRRGRLVMDAGLRVDHHHIRISENGISPRLGFAYYWEPGGLMLRTSFDKILQTPATENLLISSSQMTNSINGVEGFLSIPVSKGYFYEIGITKSISSVFRLDATHYWRHFNNYYDDDVFLNTGVSLPISFSSARIKGTEVSLELPHRKRLSTYVGYSNMLGVAKSPVTGGLFIQGNEADELRNITSTFPISQDQRNTFSLTNRYAVSDRIRLYMAIQYGSGLPVEFEDDDDDDDDRENEIPLGAIDNNLTSHSGQLIPVEILKKIDFARGRVRPNFQLDFSLSIKLWGRGKQAADLHFDLINVTNRLNVINFTGLFSGTAIAPSRMIGLRLKTQF